MKFVFAPDSFKGSLDATRMTRLLQAAALAHFPQAQCVCIPIADGGEGTVEALLTALGGTRRFARVHAPLGEPVEATYALLDGESTAALEMAQASGLARVERLDPLAASSAGTGELILAALDAGAQKILLGIGGSATNDGGMGMLRALGARFFDEAGATLSGCGADLIRVSRIDLSALSPRLRQVEIEVLCDVSNPLLGKDGATCVYGPQKGVLPHMLAPLEAGMANYAEKLSRAAGRDVASFSGAGAAGGVGAAVAGVLGARLRPGVDVVLERAGFDAHLSDASLVVTGEGRLDAQSVAFGKAPVGVARRCERAGVPVVALVGGVAEGAQDFLRIGHSAIVPVVDAPMPLGEALANAEALYARAADRLFSLLKMGVRL